MEKVLVTVSLLVLIAACSYAAESRISMKNELPLSITTLEKRAIFVPEEGGNDVTIICSDERITELLAQLSSSCKSYLTDEDGFYEFEEESTIICQSCGDTLFSFLKCLDTDPADLELFNVLCTANENGDTCYHLMSGDGIEEEELVSKCQDMTCSTACRDSLQNSFQQYGCCLYSLVALNTSKGMVHDMWSACGLDEPGLCAPAFSEDSSSSELPTTSATSTVSDETTTTPSTETNPTALDITESSTMPSEPNKGSDDANTEPTAATNIPADSNDPDSGADVAAQSAASIASSLSSSGILIAALSRIYIL